MFSIFKTFFGLGLISFGGPAAHIGYFKVTFVDKLNWLTEKEYAQLVALSQFLPGPGSSQVGFALGYRQQGLAGGIAAFAGFTLPSMIIMILVASLSANLINIPVVQAIIHGLKLLAVVVVADAAWGMFKNFCQNSLTRGLCLASAIVLLFVPSIVTQIVLLIGTALLGMIYLAKVDDSSAKVDDSSATEDLTIGKASLSWPALLLFTALLAMPLLVPLQHNLWGLVAQFYQAGSLVFGGGHVVFPLLQQSVGDQISTDAFLTGYAAAQAIPGPMFTFATYLGYLLLPQAPILGAVGATIAIFLPGFLLVIALLKEWHLFAQSPRIAGALSGVNASVVGLLISALYQPIFTSAVENSIDFAFVLCGFMLLKLAKLPLVSLVISFMLIGIAQHLFF
jgi:chromate transporter